MLDPIDTMVTLSGETVILVLQQHTAYNPNVSTDQGASTPVELPMRVVFEKSKEEGVATSRSAHLMFRENPFLAPNAHLTFAVIEDAAVIMNGSVVFARIQAEMTRVKGRGNEYLVGPIRTRIYLGKVNGFTLDMTR